MKFVHLATSLLFLNTGFLFAQSGYHGPAPVSSPSLTPTGSDSLEEELERDNINRLQSLDEKHYFEELASCLIPSQVDEEAEDLRLEEQATILERKILLSLDEQTISDPDAEEEGMERLIQEVHTQQLGQVALLVDQLSSVMTEYQLQQDDDAYLQPLLEEDSTENQEPVQWMVQLELGKIH